MSEAEVEMFTVRVIGPHHQIECGYCERREYIKGPFVLGIQTPASMQHAMQRHHLAPPISRELFKGAYEPCPAKDVWVAAAWSVVDQSGQTIAEGKYEMVDGDPVVHASIDGKVAGADWDTRRVEQLAQMEIAASHFPERSWHMGPAGGNLRVNLRRKDGKYDAAIIPLEDIHVIKVSDDEIRQLIRAKLSALDAEGQ
jgi:hypothetical protein